MPRALVTGGAGFVGSHLVDRLQNDGYDVLVIDNGISGDFSNLKPKTKILKADLAKCENEKFEDFDALYHIAAYPIRRDKLFEYKIYLEQTEGGTLAALEIARKNDIPLFVMPACYDSDTLALTAEGFKTFDELFVGDAILTINPNTRELEYQPIKELHVQPYKGPMVEIKNKRLDLLVTPNHRMIVRRRDSDKEIVFKDAMEVAKMRSPSIIPFPRWHGKENRMFLLSKFVDQDKLSWNAKRVREEFETIDILYLLGLYIGDGYIGKDTSLHASKSGRNREDYLKRSCSKENGRFVKVDEKGSINQFVVERKRVALCIPEKDRSREKVVRFLRKIGVDPKCYPGEIKFSSGALANFLASECGTTPRSKRIPTWAMAYVPEELVYLYEGLMDAGGYRGFQKNRRVRNPSYITVSRRLAKDVIELAIKLGSHPHLRSSKNHSATLFGRVIPCQESYDIEFSKRPELWFGRKDCKVVDYNGIVWCPTVENGNLLVMRNGRLTFSGNSTTLYGHANIVPTPEDFIGPDMSFYGTSKFNSERWAESYSGLFGINVLITRFGRILGPRSRNGSVWELVSRLKENPASLEVLGNGTQRRSFLHVDDCVEGMMVALKNRKGGVDRFNLANADTASVKDMVEIILEESGMNPKVVYGTEPVGWKGDNELVFPDASKLRSFGWKPKRDSKETVRDCVRWTVSEVMK